MKIAKSKLMNYLRDLSVNEKVSLVNSINSIDGNFENFTVYENDDEFFSIFFQDKPQDAVRACYFGNYNYNDEYVGFNAYGNLHTYDCFLYDEAFKNIYLEDVADWLLENVNEWDYLDIDLEEEEDEE